MQVHPNHGHDRPTVSAWRSGTSYGGPYRDWRECFPCRVHAATTDATRQAHAANVSRPGNGQPQVVVVCVVCIALLARWWLRRKYRRNLSFGSIDDGEHRLSGALLNSVMAEMVTLHEDPHGLYHGMDSSGDHDSGGRRDTARDVDAPEDSDGVGAHSPSASPSDQSRDRARSARLSHAVTDGAHASPGKGSFGAALLTSTVRQQPTASSAMSAGGGQRVQSLRTVLRRKSTTALLPQAGVVRPYAGGDLGDGGL